MRSCDHRRQLAVVISQHTILSAKNQCNYSTSSSMLKPLAPQYSDIVDAEIILRAHGFRKILVSSPPVINAPSALEVRPRDRLGDGSEMDRGSLDGYNTGRSGVSLACLLWLCFDLPRMLFDEGHTFEGESNGTSAVHW